MTSELSLQLSTPLQLLPSSMLSLHNLGFGQTPKENFYTNFWSASFSNPCSLDSTSWDSSSLIPRPKLCLCSMCEEQYLFKLHLLCCSLEMVCSQSGVNGLTLRAGFSHGSLLCVVCCPMPGFIICGDRLHAQRGVRLSLLLLFLLLLRARSLSVSLWNK